MRALRSFLAAVPFLLVCGLSSRGQNAPRLEASHESSSRQKAAAPLPAPQGLEDHVVNGKVVLTLDDGVRLALANNTDILLDHSRIDFDRVSAKLEVSRGSNEECARPRLC